MIQPEVKNFSARLQVPNLHYQNPETAYEVRIEKEEEGVYVIFPAGRINHESAKETLDLLTDIRQQFPDKKNKRVCFILDTTQLVFVSQKVKKYFSEELYQYCLAGSNIHLAIVTSNSFVRIWARWKYLLSKNTNPTFHSTYPDALKQVRAILYKGNGFESQKEAQLTKARKASHSELFRMYEQLLEENHCIKANQKQRIGELYEIIGRLTWNESFRPQQIVVEENDPFNEIFQAFSLLQEDVHEIMREQKTLTLDLETQIAERTRELAAKEAKLSSLIENTSDLLLSIDRWGNVLVINSPCKHYFSNVFQIEVSPGTNLRGILPPEVVAYWMTRFEQVFEGKAIKETKEEWVNDYAVTWEISFNPIRDRKKKVIGASVFCKDITKQKKIADKIAENEQLLDKVYNTAAIGIALIEENGDFLRVNKTYCQMYGYEEEELVGQPITLVVSPAQQSSVKENYKNFMRTGKYAPAIRKDICKNGMPVDVLVTASQYTGEGGKVFGVFTIVDITEKLQAEKAIKENQKALSDAHKIAKLGGWEFNIHTGALIFSPESLNIIGIETKDKEELHTTIDEFLAYVVHPEDVALMKKHISKAIQHQNHPNYRDSFEYRLVSNDGKVYNIISYLRFKDRNRGVIYGISQDITDRKKVVEKLKKQNLELKKVNGELDRFVYSVSHDLRSPLTSVLGLIQVIKQETDLGKIMHFLDLQEKSIHKLDNFIKDIIDLSKNARIEIHKEDIHFQQVIENIFEEQSFNKNADKIKRSISIQQNTPFISDSRRISVIFNNLISNAIRYANPQQKQPFVEVYINVKEHCAEIMVKDNGLGITNEHHDKIFDMFYRASDTISGSGLGLYIVKETLEKLNGTIRVKSESRKGTEFFLTIPNLHQ